MTRAARSIYIFGIYLIVVGALLIAIPNALLGLLRVPPTNEPWIHVLGVVVMAMGILHMASARAEQAGFFRASIWARFFVLTAFIVFALLKVAPAVVILFGVTDVTFATWTYLALRSQPQMMTGQTT